MKTSLRATRFSGLVLLALFLISVSACGGDSPATGNQTTPSETVVTGRA